jgi:uncharacterized protein with von Willebrand factor type A (vWA) domain
VAWTDPPAGGDRLLRNALTFSRTLRRAGLAADLAAVLDFARALSLVDIGEREQVKAAGSTLFVRRREDIAPYGVVFDAFWRRHAFTPMPTPNESEESNELEIEVAEVGEGATATEDIESALLEAGEGEGEESEGDLAPAPVAYSAAESLRHRDFDRMTPSELREATRLVDRMQPTLETRLVRRWELHSHGRRLAPRAMFRRNLATGGDALTWLWRRPVRRPRTIVVICDISGSMERHSRLLLRFAQALARSQVRTEAFVFGTRLTRVTRQLRGRDPDRALERVSAAVSDWSGGTRIGASFHDFNRLWSRRVLRSSGIVVVVSDGWDRGSAELVGEETARLRRSCHRLVWLNPLAGAASYQPLAAGMAAAYPHVDDFLPANDLASLDRLGDLLAGEFGGRRPRRRRRPPILNLGRMVGPGREGQGLAGAGGRS